MTSIRVTLQDTIQAVINSPTHNPLAVAMMRMGATNVLLHQVQEDSPSSPTRLVLDFTTKTGERCRGYLSHATIGWLRQLTYGERHEAFEWRKPKNSKVDIAMPQVFQFQSMRRLV